MKTWREKFADAWHDIKYRWKHGDDREWFEWDEHEFRHMKNDKVRGRVAWTDVSRATFWQVNTHVFNIDAVRLGDDQDQGHTFDDIVTGFWEFAKVVDTYFPGYYKALSNFSNGAFQSFESGGKAPTVDLRLRHGHPVEHIHVDHS